MLTCPDDKAMEATRLDVTCEIICVQAGPRLTIRSTSRLITCKRYENVTAQLRTKERTPTSEHHAAMERMIPPYTSGHRGRHRAISSGLGQSRPPLLHVTCTFTRTKFLAYRTQQALLFILQIGRLERQVRLSSLSPMRGDDLQAPCSSRSFDEWSCVCLISQKYSMYSCSLQVLESASTCTCIQGFPFASTPGVPLHRSIR
jgi:hypothetical protein